MEPLVGFIKETDGIHSAFYDDFHDCRVDWSRGNKIRNRGNSLE